MAMSTNGNGGIRPPPKWLWEGVILVAFVAVCGLVVAQYDDDVDAASKEAREATKTNNDQEKTLENHKTRLDWHDLEEQRSQAWRTRMEDKMDRIYEAVSGQ